MMNETYYVVVVSFLLHLHFLFLIEQKLTLFLEHEKEVKKHL